MELLEGLDPELATGDRLGELAVRLMEPSETLRNSEKRDHIIGLLKLPKARELADRLGVGDGRYLYRDLRHAASDSSALPVLFSFFGVARDPHASADRTPNRATATASYGLFEHQRAVVAKVTRALSVPPRKIVLHMPTGSGKTRAAMHVLADHLKSNAPTLIFWLAQNAELLDQAADEFERAWGCLGDRPVDLVRYWGQRNPNLLAVHDGVIVTGLGKLHAFDNREPAAMLRLSDRTSLTVIDEAHQAIAPTYSSLLTTLYTKRPNNALLGLTATPGRTWSDIGEDQKLSDYFDGRKVTLDVAGYEDPINFLINEGYLAKPTFRTLNSEAGLQLSTRDVHELSNAIDVPNSLLDRLGADTQRSLKILSEVEQLMKKHRRVIVFAPSVENARLLATVLSARGLEAHAITGQSTTSHRESVIRRYRSNIDRSIALINFGVFTTGFDAPATSAGVIARPTKSLVLYSQMVGRATRGARAGGNQHAEIVTVLDPHLPGFGSIADAFTNWEDVWHESK